MSANHTAEAIWIVIKRILKWFLLIAVGLGIVVGLFVAYADYQNTKDFERRKALEDKVIITAGHRGSDCESAYPYFYGIVNQSDRQVNNVKFRVEIRRTGFSGALNSYTSLDEDKILKPGEGFGRCFRAQNKDYSGELREKDVEIIIVYKDVNFSD